VESLFTLFALALTGGAILVTVLAAGVAAKSFYKVPVADEALVKTGGKRPAVSTGGGMWVIPLFHRITRLSLQAIRIPIDRVGDNALPTADKLMAEMRGELFVQVNPRSEADILQAVQSLGASNPADMAAIVRQKIDSLVTDALRTAAFKKSFLELNSQKKEFADEVIGLLQEDLARLGLTLTAVSIPHIYQGRFTEDAGDVFAAEGRRNVAETVARNREQTNRIEREAQIAIQEQDVSARERSLKLELVQKQKEADQRRQVDEYEAEQTAATRLAVLEQERATAVAEAQQARAVAETEIAEEQKVQTAKIRKIETVETAEIAKVRALKVAEERRRQAIEEAEIAREVAIAAKRAEEAAARASQADAEAKQRESEEAILTVEAKATAQRHLEVITIKAREEASKEQIAADRNAYVETTKATAELDAATKRAEARRILAEAILDEGRARAEARRLEVEAENAVASQLLLRDVAVKGLEVAPHMIRELMAPVANVAHDVKILQVQGLGGGENGEVGGLPATILNTGLAAAGVAPFLMEASKAVMGNSEVAELTDLISGLASQAMGGAADTLKNGLAADAQKQLPDNTDDVDAHEKEQEEADEEEVAAK